MTDIITQVYKEIGDKLFSRKDLTQVSLIAMRGDVVVNLDTSGAGDDYSLSISQGESQILFSPYEDSGEARRLAGLLLAWADKFDPRCS